MIPLPADQPVVWQQGLLDTNILILRHRIPSASLPARVAISAVTLAELSAGVHLVRGDDHVARMERARRMDIVARVESEFDPIPFDGQAARLFGRISAAVADTGRTTRSRVADLMIAATAAAAGLPLYTTNPDDFRGVEAIVPVVAVIRPSS